MNAWDATMHSINCYMAAMKTDPLPSLEDRILSALPSGVIKTFSQIEMASGSLDPKNVANPETFSNQLDAKLRELMACGKVRLVARKPTLCFVRGTVLDRIIKEIELDG